MRPTEPTLLKPSPKIKGIRIGRQLLVQPRTTLYAQVRQNPVGPRKRPPPPEQRFEQPRDAGLVPAQLEMVEPEIVKLFEEVDVKPVEDDDADRQDAQQAGVAQRGAVGETRAGEESKPVRLERGKTEDLCDSYGKKKVSNRKKMTTPMPRTLTGWGGSGWYRGRNQSKEKKKSGGLDCEGQRNCRAVANDDADGKHRQHGAVGDTWARGTGTSGGPRPRTENGTYATQVGVAQHGAA